MAYKHNPFTGRLDYYSGELGDYVPYTGATDDVNLGDHDLITSGQVWADNFYASTSESEPLSDCVGVRSVSTVNGSGSAYGLQFTAITNSSGSAFGMYGDAQTTASASSWAIGAVAFADIDVDNGKGIGGYFYTSDAYSADTSIGLLADSANQGAYSSLTGDWAGYFRGDVNITGNLNINGVPSKTLTLTYGKLALTKVAKPTACSAALAGAGAGNVDNGTHYYRVTFVTADGETEVSNVSNVVTVVDKTVDGKVSLTAIEVGETSEGVTSRKLYRTKAGSGSTGQYFYLATISDNTTTTYTDNTADSSLGVRSEYRDNTTGGKLYLGGTLAGFFGTGSGDFISGNTSFGVASLYSLTTGAWNVAIGYRALYSNTTGSNNFAIGYDALRKNTSGTDNFALGPQALIENTTGSNNIAIGRNALFYNKTGAYNFGFGYYALFNNTGTGNVGVGEQSLYSNTSGTYNVGMGYHPMRFNQTGSNNTAIGYLAGYGVSTNSFSNNSFFGSRAGVALTTGSNNILLGYQAGEALTNGSNNIIIGYDIDAPSATGSNQLSIGNLVFGTGIDGTGTTISTGNIGIGVASPVAKFHVDQSSTTGAVPVLTVDQADVSEEFIRFIGTSTTDNSQSLVDATDLTTPGSIAGWIKIYIQDDQATNPIADGIYWIPFYTTPTT